MTHSSKFVAVAPVRDHVLVLVEMCSVAIFVLISGFRRENAVLS
jgi:hypothetical protein